VDKFGPSGVVVASLTRAAAREVAGRDLGGLVEENVGTLHALCWRALGRPRLVADQLAEWNQAHPHWALSGARDSADEAPAAVDPRKGAPGDERVERMENLRQRRVPPEAWPEDVGAFAAAWGDWKSKAGLLDFTDLLELCLRDGVSPAGSPSAGYFDETQDWSPLELALVRQWAEEMDGIVLVGDPAQCQPAGTMVDVVGAGPVPIEFLDPKKHRVQSFDSREGTICGRGRSTRASSGRRFNVARRHYEGEMLRVTVGLSSTECTPDHVWVARWNPDARRKGRCCVYLMRRGDRWRVGWCQVFNADGGLHLWMRARLEKADAIWVLEVVDSRARASEIESAVAARYGLPTICFEPRPESTRGHMTRESIERVFGALAEIDLTVRAKECLKRHGREVAWPLISNPRPKGRNTIFRVRACNLIEELMCVPVTWPNGRDVRWLPVSIEIEDEFEGPVYSLEVERDVTYVADGIVTHNCLYSWRGSAPRGFLEPAIDEKDWRVLAQSYRVPRVVRDASLAWIRRCETEVDFEYHARDDDGELVTMNGGGYLSRGLGDGEWVADELERRTENGDTAMVLASCAYMLQATIRSLRARGAPFWNPWRTKNGAWNPLRGGADRLVSMIRPMRPDLLGGTDPSRVRVWTFPELLRFLEPVEAEGALRKGGKKHLQARARDDAKLANPLPATSTDLEAILEPAALGSLREAMMSPAPWRWLGDRLLESWRARLEYALAVCEKRGARALVDEPRIVTGTVHSTKGAEATHVLLSPELSTSGADEWVRGGEHRDAVRRVFYVGMTRARRSLTLLSPSGGRSVPWQR